jgi:acetylornithine deacetylase/succinyl-diaminopimelate desuccinylase-like protein
MDRRDSKWSLALALAALAAAPAARAADAQALAPEQKLLREVYQELLEIDTTDSAGDTTRAANAMAARLRSAGFGDDDLRILVPSDAPRKGNLVARLRGRGAKKPLLLLAHLDVVEAKRADWKRDPFKLVEENGYFFARGAIDDKAMAALFVTTMMRLRQERYAPDRDLVLALTADEEIVPSKFNGVRFLLREHRDLIDAALALNEGGFGLIDKSGKYLYHGVEAGEKVYQTYRLEVTNPGGHSSRPARDNAIYHLADGLSRLGKYDFPFKLNAVTRAYFQRAADVESGQVAADMKAIVKDPPDPQAVARLFDIPAYGSLMHTTCVATMADAGHAPNALPQRARAVVNCRILPGEPVDEVRQTLVRVLADDKIALAPDGDAVQSPAPPLTPEIMKPIEQISRDLWPDVPVIPTMLAAATDGSFLNGAGIPTYGVSGIFRDMDGSGVHGLDERLRVKSLHDAQAFMHRLVRALSGDARAAEPQRGPQRAARSTASGSR